MQGPFRFEFARHCCECRCHRRLATEERQRQSQNQPNCGIWSLLPSHLSLRCGPRTHNTAWARTGSAPSPLTQTLGPNPAKPTISAPKTTKHEAHSRVSSCVGIILRDEVDGDQNEPRNGQRE